MARPLDKSREVKLRRAADRQGLKLQKSPRRDPLAVGADTYRLYNPHTKRVVVGSATVYGMTLNQIEDALRSGEFAAKVEEVQS